MSMRDRIAKAILGGKVGGPTPTGIHVYHSSPHDFDRFDLSKIGTGEGAQVYGHGIYAAENPAVSGQGGQYWNQFKNRFSGEQRDAASTLQRVGFDREQAAALIRKDIEDARRMLKEGFQSFQPGDPRMAQALATKEAELKLLESGASVGPRTYEVNFRAKPEELLDWDKPLAKQSEHVLSGLDRVWGLPSKETQQTMQGRDAYGLVGVSRRSGDEALYPHSSAALAEAGIPGIRYLDEGSRNLYGPAQGMIDNYGSREAALAKAQRFLEGGHGDPAHYGQMVELLQKKPTHNYVAFDPSKLDIMAKYGIVGATGGVLGAGAMGGTIDQSSYGARQ